MKTMEPTIEKNKIHDLDELLNRLSVTIRSHSRRVAICSAIIAEYASSFMSLYGIPEGMSLPLIAHSGGTCHDIGKLLLPALDANGDDYFQHPVLGADLLEKHKSELFGNEPYASFVLEIVRYHHEHNDGGGFPEGLKSRDIPLTAGICSIADMLDHFMFSDSKSNADEALVYRILEEQAGKIYCECVWICTEHAWPRLAERYALWNSI